MKDIYIFKDGITIFAKIEKLFGTHGPYTIEGKRLDQLSKVELLVDSSTSTIKQTGTVNEHAKNSSMLGRAVVGGVLAGGTGAVIGGLSGKKESISSSVSSEVINTDLTAQLVFEDSSSMYVRIRGINAFHWLLGFANMKPLTDEELEAEKSKALDSKLEMQLKDAHERAVSAVGYPKYGNKQAVKKAEDEILETTFKILQDTPDVARVVDYGEFVSIYQNTINKNNVIDKPKKYSIYWILSWMFGILLLISGLNEELAKKEAQDQIEKATSLQQQDVNYFNKNSSQILNEVRAAFESGNFKEAVSLSSKYLPAQNQDLIDLNTKAKSELFKIEKAEKEEKEKAEREAKTQEILVQLKNVPASQYQRNRDLYQQLATYNPGVKKYKEKLNYFSAKLIEEQKKESKKEREKWEKIYEKYEKNEQR